MPDSIPPTRQAPASVVGTTLREHVLAAMRAAPGATGEFTSLLNHISLAVRIISSRVRSAGLAGMLGYTGDTNVQGEAVQKLDEFANDVLRNVLERCGHCGVLASEELDDAIFVKERGKYTVLFDPLDGSSNIDSNVSIGTIFAILRRDSPDNEPTLADALRRGRDIVAAGYAVYGPSTMMVLATRNGVDAFTLDPSVGEFFLSHPALRIPEKGNIYSCNEGNSIHWSPPVQRWCRWIKGEDASAGTPYSARYVGSLVADAHRTLFKGGIFVYPSDVKNKSGKLRLLYEANPMAYVFEQAGGAATDGVTPILDIVPNALHQRIPLVLGSKADVEAYRGFVDGSRPSAQST